MKVLGRMWLLLLVSAGGGGCVSLGIGRFRRVVFGWHFTPTQ